MIIRVYYSIFVSLVVSCQIIFHLHLHLSPSAHSPAWTLTVATRIGHTKDRALPFFYRLYAYFQNLGRLGINQQKKTITKQIQINIYQPFLAGTYGKSSCWCHMAMSWKDDKQNTPTHIFNMHNFGGKMLIHTHSIVCDDLYKSPISRSFKANHSALSQQPNTSQRPAATQPPALRTPRAGRRHRRSADPAAAAAAQSLRDLWKKSTGSTAQPFSLGFIYPAIVVP